MTREQLPPRERENDDPEEQVRPLPRPLIALIVLGMCWGAWYLGTSATDTSAMLGDARTSAGLAALPAGGRVEGVQVFTGKCAACHQATGLGLAGVFPPLANSPWVLVSDRRLVQILLHGIQEPIEVLGASYNGIMPAWKTLSDDEIAAVATYVRGSFGNAASPVTVALVAAERARTASRTTPWRGGAELDTLR